MNGLFASGRVVDLVLALTALEFVAIVAWRRRTGRGIGPGRLATMLLPGVFLMLALRAALVGGWWGFAALWLAAAGAAHVVDVRRRWATGSPQEK